MLRLPSLPLIRSLALSHQSLAFRAAAMRNYAKNETPEEEAGATRLTVNTRESF